MAKDAGVRQVTRPPVVNSLVKILIQRRRGLGRAGGDAGIDVPQGVDLGRAGVFGRKFGRGAFQNGAHFVQFDQFPVAQRADHCAQSRAVFDDPFGLKSPERLSHRRT